MASKDVLVASGGPGLGARLCIGMRERPGASGGALAKEVERNRCRRAGGGLAIGCRCDAWMALTVDTCGVIVANAGAGANGAV